MARTCLTDAQWERVAPPVPGKPGDPGATGRDNRRFVGAVLWAARTGAPRRDLPAEFGGRNSAWRRLARWSARGVWERLFEAAAEDLDFGHVAIDATIVRAHQHGAGGKGGAEAQAIGRSRGGPSTKLHVAVDALGNPVRAPLTPGQRHEMTQAAALAGGPRAGWLIADTALDADAFRRGLAEAGTAAVIPSSPSRARAVPRDRDLHKDRHVVECFFAKLEQFRRIATRHEKTAANFLALVHLACAVIPMR